MNADRPTAVPDSPVIDVHWHHVPMSLLNAILDGSCPYNGRYAAGEGFGTLTPAEGLAVELNESLVDLDAALSVLESVGVDTALASLAPPLMQNDAPIADAIAFSAAVNDAFAVIAADHRASILPLADVPLQDPVAAAIEVRRALGDLGLGGVAIGSSVNGQSLGDDTFLPFWETVAELDAFVFVHGVQSTTWLARLAPAAVLGSFVGVPIDTAMSIGSLMFNGVLERFPSLHLCFSHGGGAFPYLFGRWEHGWHHRARSRQRLSSPPSENLEPIYCDSLTHDDRALHYLLETIGEDHVLLGSDYPFDMGDANAPATLRDAIGDSRVRALVCGGTARGLVAPLKGGMASPQSPS